MIHTKFPNCIWRKQIYNIVHFCHQQKLYKMGPSLSDQCGVHRHVGASTVVWDKSNAQPLDFSCFRNTTLIAGQVATKPDELQFGRNGHCCPVLKQKCLTFFLVVINIAVYRLMPVPPIANISATFLWLSQTRTRISNVKCRSLFFYYYVQWVEVRGDCSFCWY